jgi:acyl carrier protein
VAVNAHQASVELADLSRDGDMLSAITAGLRTLLANELQLQESDVDENVQFLDLGLDSITGVTWVRTINEKYHTSIDATKVYSYPTLGQFARFVRDEAEKNGALSNACAPSVVQMPVASGKSKASSAKYTKSIKLAGQKLTSRRSRTTSRFSSPQAPQIVNSPQPIAVIGMAGQFPQAKNLEEFWQNIAQGRNCITQVPSERWDVNAYYQPGEPVEGKTNSRWIGALEEYDRFDPLFFNVSPTEAESMDPQQRLFLRRAGTVLKTRDMTRERYPGASVEFSSAAPLEITISSRGSMN